MKIYLHNPRGNERILKKMNLKNEEVVLTEDSGGLSRVLTLYQKHNIADGLDTYKKVATKEYSESKARIEWRSEDEVTVLRRVWAPQNSKSKPQKNIFSKAWELVSYFVNDFSLSAKYDANIYGKDFQEFQLKSRISDLTPKAKRAVRLLNKIVK